MTQEDKELLLKDLCGRLPYGIKCKDQYGEYIDINIYNVHIEHLIDQISSGEIKMVLRLMSSMTEEEKKEYDNFLFDNLEGESVIGYEDKRYGIDVIMRYRSGEVVDWLNEHHFDYRGLIEEYCLAIEAPESMYDYYEM